MPMDRLTAEDRVMLWPDELWPQDLGVLALLDGERLLDARGEVRLEAVRRVVGARLHRVPRFRQLLYVPRRGLGGPLWVDAPAFDLSEHVRVRPLPAPGDEAALLRTVEELRRRRLDRSRPLWEMWLLPGLPDRRVGLYVRMHHAIGDGIAGVATLGTFLDQVPGPPATPAPPWTPAPRPPARELAADNLRRRSRAAARALATLVRPVRTARQVRGGWRDARAMFTRQVEPGTSLNRVVGPGRALALVRADLDEVVRVAHGHGATVNDVLLAAVAGGLRAQFGARGEPVGDLPVYVPVTLRPAGSRAQARGNLIGQMVVRLPLGEPDPSLRLRRIAAATAVQKAKGHPPLGSVLGSRLARRLLLKALDRHPVSVTTADVPGPARPLHLAGARLLEAYPMLPLIGSVSLGVGALSYAGRLGITAVADRDACPDLDVFAAGVRAELAALAGAAAPRPVAHGPG